MIHIFLYLENENSYYLQKAKSLLLQLYQRLQVVVVVVAIQTQLLIAKLPPFHRGTFIFTAKSASSNIFEDGILEALPQNKEIAFEFELPTTLVI
jgi:hypothetical protein